MRPTTRRAAAGAAVLLLALAGCGADDGAPDAGGAAATTGTTPSPSTSATPTTPSASPTSTTPSPTATSRTRTASPSPSSSSRSAAQRLAPVPRAGAGPAVRFPRNAAAVGAGANATVSRVPDAVWDRMVGYSWTPGCPVGRSSLRYVQVNFWGFDGKRSRGSLVVHQAVAAKAARAFTSLYAQQFRIRQMRPMDASWGKNPKGPGADDYAAMEADNTSAFNCRYVGGQEQKKQYSNHAYGKAIDVNDFENPYVDDDGTVYPDPYFLRHRSGAGVFTSSRSAATRAFTSQGLRWGGRWSHPDYQHFDG